MAQDGSNAGALGGLDIDFESPEAVTKAPVAQESISAADVEAIIARVRAEESSKIDALLKLVAQKDAEADDLRKAAEARQLVDHHRTSANESRASSKERWAIKIDEARDPNEVDPVFVQVNGRGYNIRRGQIVEVPREVVSVLNDAIEHKSVPVKDAAGNPAGYVVRKARRFPFQQFGKTIDKDGSRLKTVSEESQELV